MKEKIVIIGAGGFAREVLDIFEACNAAGQDFEVLGYLVDTQYGRPGTLINDRPILGDCDWLIKNGKDVRAVCAVGDPAGRKKLVERAKALGTRFYNIIHPSAIMTKRVSLGQGNVIAAGCILTNNIRIGDHVHINLACTIGHDAVLDQYATLAPGVHVSGCVTLGEGCYIGSGVNIIDRKTVGDRKSVV
jgi:sugar O-acyltransferase (sialic acid O-acetyltransferase NeuD family)